MKKIVTLLLVFALALSLVACGNNTTAPADEPATNTSTATESDEIVMGTNAAFEPFEFVEESGVVDTFSGIDVEIAQAIAEKAGKTLKINDMEFESLLGALNTGKVDFVAAGMTANDERRKEVDFSDTYYVATQGIIVKEGSDIKGIADLTDKTVGAVTGYTGEKICTDDLKLNTVTYKRGVDAVMELVNGKLDAVVIDLQPAKMFASKNEGLTVVEDPDFEAEEYAIAVSKDNPELLATINAALADLKSSGKLDEIIDKYQNAE